MGAETSEWEIILAAGKYAEELYAAGKSVKEVIAALESQHLSSADAYEVAHRVYRLRGLRIEKQTANRKAGRTKMWLGAAICLGGIVVTAATFFSADSGESYIIAWGAILFGFIWFLLGWTQAKERN